jgi:peptidoglycan/xylan/chitin deacetylase (PgdA/CDA1 family)
MTVAQHGRFDYIPISARPDFVWPDGRRLAVYLGVNLEHFAFGEGLGAQLAPGGPQPDILNYAWRDYGNRVGAWRLLDMLDALNLPATVLANSAMFDYAPELIAAHVTRVDEIAGHGHTNSERQSAMDEATEAAMIARATLIITDAYQVPPKGWLSPWIAESLKTPDLLIEHGYNYTLNWCMDDQPVWMRTRSGPLLAVPYPQEVNDIPAIVSRKGSAADFADLIIDTFDEMRDQSAQQTLVMGIALHPYIIGQPGRLRQLRRALVHICNQRDAVWITRAKDIAATFAAVTPTPKTGLKL